MVLYHHVLNRVIVFYFILSGASYWLVYGVIETVNVELTLGNVVGKRDGNVNTFFGIPFAEPPILNYRFKPSIPKRPWTPRVLECFKFSPMCMQSSLYSVGDEGESAEDCLYLNIWAPSKPSKSGGYPVLLWIYGGAFMQGSSSSPAYMGDRLAGRGVVVVSFNYRLGALGFLVSTPDGLFGNYGLHDQKLAMQWVQDHIGQFGGDPDKVTLFGESAGAMSTGLHLLDQYGKKLFRAVILQSNPLGYKYRSITVANFIGAGFKDALDCEDLRCLQAESADELMHIQDTFMAVPRSIGDFFTWGPVVTDGVYRREIRVRSRRDTVVSNVSVQQPLHVLRALQRFDIPVILGANTHEGNVFVFTAFPARMNKYIFQAITFTFFRGDTPKVLRAYASRTSTVSEKPHGDYREVLAEIIGDYLFRCPTRLTASLINDLGAPVWLYEFALPTRTPGFSCCDGMACHTAELPYVFEQMTLIEKEYSWHGKKAGFQGPEAVNSSSAMNAIISPFAELTGLSSLPAMIGSAATWMTGSYGTKSGGDAKVAKFMADFWVSFATHLDPNGVLSRNGYKIMPDGPPYWPNLAGNIGNLSKTLAKPPPVEDKIKGIKTDPSSPKPSPTNRINSVIPFLSRYTKEFEERYMHVFQFNITSEPLIQQGDCYCDFWNRLEYKF